MMNKNRTHKVSADFSATGIRLFMACVDAISAEEKGILKQALSQNIQDIGKSDPSAETAIKILISIGANVVNDVAAKSREIIAGCN